MNIQKINTNNSNNTVQIDTHKKQNPNFKAGAFVGVLNGAGTVMQGIENGGFLASFLVQDVIGMTAPRVGAAFLRDKEVTGHYNVQEGFEVLGREGLTGPSMMAVAPIVMAIASKTGRSTTINSQFIRRLGQNLKSMLGNSSFNKELLTKPKELKDEFLKLNIRQALENTLGKENTKDESVEYILQQIKNYEDIPKEIVEKKKEGIKEKLFWKKNYKSSCVGNIAEHINNIKMSTSDDLNMLNFVEFGEGSSKKRFKTTDFVDAIIKFSNDATTLNKKLSSMDTEAADNLMNSLVAKRFFTNIAGMASTLGVLSVLPKLYIRSSISPGARTAMQLKEAQLKNSNNLETNDEINEKPNDSTEEISFKGKKPKLSKFGKFLSDHTNEKYSSELEYNGHNFTNTLMAGLSVFGLIVPRGLKAYNRAQVDKDGKRDMTELYEILIRDLTSSLSVVFAVPILTRMFVTSYEKSTGFVLIKKDRTEKGGFKTFKNLINPYSNQFVMNNSEIAALYGGVDTKEKMLNFCKYIDKNEGDLAKILSKSEFANEIFNKNTKTLEDIANLPKSEKNETITSIIRNLGKNDNLDKSTVDNMIKKLMKGTKGNKKTAKILSLARGLNSVPGVLTTFLISPYILGWFIPRLTYLNTRRINEKKAAAEAQKNNDEKKISVNA